MKQRIYYYVFGILLFIACAVLIFSCNNQKSSQQGESIVWDTAAAFLLDSMVEMDKFTTPKAYVSDEDYTLIEYPAYFIPSGYYHDGEVTDDMTKAEWHSLYMQDGGFQLEPTTIKFERVHDDIVDDLNDTTGWGVTANHESEYFIANVANLKEGAIEQLQLDTNIVLPGESTYFELGGVQYRLYASSYQYKEEGTDFYSYRNYKLYLEKNENGIVTTQLIVASPYHMDAYSVCNILFAGDIDKDNKPDFIINTSNHYNTFMPTVFISGAAEEGELLKVVAMHVSVGC